MKIDKETCFNALNQLGFNEVMELDGKEGVIGWNCENNSVIIDNVKISVDNPTKGLRIQRKHGDDERMAIQRIYSDSTSNAVLCEAIESLLRIVNEEV